MLNQNATFKVRYDGLALQNHEINVKDLAPALLSLAELLEEANRQLNNESIKISVNLRATNEGSVEVDLNVVQSIIDQTAALFDSQNVNAAINAYSLLKIIGIVGGGGGVIKIIIWLRNRKIEKITKLDTGDFQIEVEGDTEIKIASKKEIRLFRDLKIRKNLEAIVKRPLDTEGIESVEFSALQEPKVKIKREEKDYFTSPPIEEELLDTQIIITNLQIVNLSFQEEGKWRFSDGSSPFFAEINDKKFLQQIQKNQTAFAKDDILKVKLKKTQYLTENGTINLTHSIEEVIEHRSAAVQIELPFDNDNNDGDGNDN